FSDGNAQRIRLFNLSTGAISVAAGSGTSGFSGDGASAFNAYLKNPRGVTVDSAGNLYFADSGNHVIRKVDTSSNISTIAGTAGKPSPSRRTTPCSSRIPATIACAASPPTARLPLSRESEPPATTATADPPPAPR